MLHDNETKTDLFSYEPSLEMIVVLLVVLLDAPMTIGIHQ